MVSILRLALDGWRFIVSSIFKLIILLNRNGQINHRTFRIMRKTVSSSRVINGDIFHQKTALFAREKYNLHPSSIAIWTLMSSRQNACPIQLLQLSMLMHIRHIIPTEILRKIIDSLVLSQVRYCLYVYGSASRTNVLEQKCKNINFSARVVQDKRKFEHASDVDELG